MAARNPALQPCGERHGGGRLNGQPVMLIGHQKGHTAAELSARNFGMPNPAGYRKAARLMRLAAKLNVPLITLVDTPGAYPGIEAEQNGQAIAIAENLRLMAGLPIPVIGRIGAGKLYFDLRTLDDEAAFVAQLDKLGAV